MLVSKPHILYKRQTLNLVERNEPKWKNIFWLQTMTERWFKVRG